jgi:hypothetical protein
MVQLVRPTDCVLEIGSSVGECTALLGAALAPSRVVGVDTSKEQLAISKAKYPHLTFERADALTDPLMVLEIVEELRARCAATRGDGDCGGDGDVGGVTAVSRRDLVAAIKAAGGVMASLKKSGMNQAGRRNVYSIPSSSILLCMTGRLCSTIASKICEKQSRPRLTRVDSKTIAARVAGASGSPETRAGLPRAYHRTLRAELSFR